MAALAGAAARTGEAMAGRAFVATTRPACGTTAATLLNMVDRCVRCAEDIRTGRRMAVNGIVGLKSVRGCGGEM